MADQRPPPPVEGGVAGATEVLAPVTGGPSGRGGPKRRGSTIEIRPGTRIEDGYPLTQDELWLLGSLGAGATALFALASGMVGYYVNVGLSIAFSQGVSEKIIAQYEATQWWAIRTAIAL